MQEVRGMAKIKRKLHIQFRSIRNRMIFSFLLVFLAVLVFMGASIYLFTVNMLETRNQQSYEKILESAENVLDDRFSIYKGNCKVSTRRSGSTGGHCRKRTAHPENL